MRVTFLLPGFKVRPGGGTLVIYRYANALQQRGHQVQLVYLRQPIPAAGAISRLKGSTWRLRQGLRYGGRPPWFKVDSRVAIRWAKDLREHHIPAGDAVVATDCGMVPSVFEYGESKGTKIYLIQGFEDWSCGKDGVHAAWKMPLHKVVVSRWLCDAIAAVGEAERVTYIPPGVELDFFRADVAIAERNPCRIGMLAHTWGVKGLTYGADALAGVREMLPDIQAVAFGAARRPRELPAWIEYVQQPTRRELAALYNSVAIFLHSSVIEGWPMPPAEAMACGCALVASDSRGVRDYAVDGETALVAPVRDSSALASRLLQLIENRDLRLRLATAGQRLIQNFGASQSTDRLESLLARVVER